MSDQQCKNFIPGSASYISVSGSENSKWERLNGEGLWPPAASAAAPPPADGGTLPSTAAPTNRPFC